MVATMKKFVFIAFHKDWDQFLLNLRDMGMIHVVEHDRKDIDEDTLYELISNKKQLEEAKKILIRSRDNKSVDTFNEPDTEIGKTIPYEIEKIEAEKTALSQQFMVASKERDSLKSWGNFDPEQIKKLKAAGYNINFFISPNIKFNPEWEELYDVLIVRRESSRTYFITVSREGNMSELLDLEEEKLPDVSLNTLNKLIDSLNEKFKLQDEALVKLSNNIPSLDAAITVLENEIQFSKVEHSGTGPQ